MRTAYPCNLAAVGMVLVVVMCGGKGELLTVRQESLRSATPSLRRPHHHLCHHHCYGTGVDGDM